jgi:predicted Zn-dependent peptidase
MKLVREFQVFTKIGAYVTGSVDPGLLVITGQLAPGVSLDEAESKVFEVINDLLENGLLSGELEKVKNQAESSITFGEMELLQRAMNLAFHARNGDPEEINRESDHIRQVTEDQLIISARKTLRRENCNVLHYNKS